MEMNKDSYQDLILRFSKELNEVGVTQSCIDLIKDKYSRTPNVISCSSEDIVAKFCYQHNGFKIEAKQVVTLELKKVKWGCFD